MLIDTHAHLDMEQFDSDRDEVIQRALSADVGQVVTVGIDVSNSLKAISMAEIYPSVFAAVGIHPHNVDIAQKVAHIRGLTLEEVAKQTSENARRLFGLPLRTYEHQSHR
ncbi:MAG: TatD family hydrolase [Deltaproteobacteria bacterium]|nr:TatD family hydrolase [Deltaproteobacteria bacterium]